MTSAQESTNSPFNSLRRLFKREKKVAVAPTIIPAKAVDATGRWSTYTQQYRNGDFDFESPPPPPAQLGAGESFAAPIPRNEKQRQAAVDNLRLNVESHKPISFISAVPDAAPVSCDPRSLPPSSYRSSDSTSSTEDSYDDSLSDRSSGSPASSQSLPLPKDLPPPENVPYRAALQNIVERARAKFGTSVSIINLSDKSQHVFLAETGLSAFTVMDRGTTPCTHSNLKASTGDDSAFAVLDLAADWRWRNGNFGGSRFYASAPIMANGPLGDSTTLYAIGTLCILDPSPRSSFSTDERTKLMELAKEAGQQLQNWTTESRVERGKYINSSRVDWRKNKLVQQYSPKGSLPSVQELESEDVEYDDITLPVRSSAEGEREGRSSFTFENFASTSRPPLSKYPRAEGMQAVQVGSSGRINAGVASVFTLSCQLLAESLELSFAYIIAVDMTPPAVATPGSTAGQRMEPQMLVLATHNVPYPTPAFDYHSHRAILDDTERGAALFTDVNASLNHYKTGLLARIGTTKRMVPGWDGELELREMGYLLCGFSDRTSRVLGTQEWAFFKTHARDLAPFLTLIDAPSS